jgi:phage I-like protein
VLTLPAESKTVLALSAPFRSGGAAADLPQRVRILKWGENIGRTTGARILVDEKAAALSANQELVAIEQVPMDYEHQSHKGHPNYQPDPRHSPGFGKIEVIDGDGIYLSAIEYTPNGLAHAASYRDVSAVVHLDGDGRPLWVSSVALTQTGDVSGMEFAEAVAALSARINHNSNPSDTNSHPTMNETFRALLIKLLKLPETATDEEITTAVESASTETEVETETKPMETDTVAALSARLDLIERNQLTTDRKALVDRASREGKVIPLSAALIEQTPVAVLSAMVDSLPAGEVPLATGQQGEKPGDKVVALSADEKKAAKILGLSDAEYLAGKA